MRKSFKFYALIWAVFFAAFNAVVFLVRPVIPGYVVSYDTRFWVAWAFIVAAFMGNLACAYLAFRSENRKKTFYRFSLITISWSGLITMLVAGAVLMLIPDCPAWIAAIVCIVIFAFNAVAVIKALWAGDEAGRIEDKVKTQTAFIKNLTADAQSLVARAKSDAVKAECDKVYEAIRYSDPMSGGALSGVEAQIASKLGELSAAVDSDDAAKVKELADGLVILVGDRNNRIRLNK